MSIYMVYKWKYNKSIDNGNMTSNELNNRGLHLNPRGLGKLAY